MALTPNRIWMALFAVALLAFAGCAAGAVDCAIFKPVGLTAALGAAAVSLFDTGKPATEDAPAD